MLAIKKQSFSILTIFQFIPVPICFIKIFLPLTWYIFYGKWLFLFKKNFPKSSTILLIKLYPGVVGIFCRKESFYTALEFLKLTLLQSQLLRVNHTLKQSPPRQKWFQSGRMYADLSQFPTTISFWGHKELETYLHSRLQCATQLCAHVWVSSLTSCPHA